MHKHHKESIDNITCKLRNNAEILAVIVGGSIAYGLEREDSDIDLLLLVSNDSCCTRIKNGNMHYYETEACTYKGGHIDGKYICMDFIDKVARQGNEPSRFAFQGAFVTYTRIQGVEKMLKSAARYPLEQKEDKIRRFFAQVEAWKWYYYEGMKRRDEFLINQAVTNLVFFGGRLILSHNQMLYPYHKWFMKQLERAEHKPEDFMKKLEDVMQKRDRDSVEALYNSILKFRNWGVDSKDWINQFMIDNELNWLSGNTPVADI